MASSSNQRRPIKAVIFDMDGLLLDSESLYTRITNEILAPYNKQLTWEIKVKIMGRSALDSAAILIQHTRIPLTPTELVEAMSARQRTLFPAVQPMPGAVRLVQHLKRHRLPIAIATGSNRVNYELKSRNLPQLFSHFEGCVVCGDDWQLKRGKPHPDPFCLAAYRYLGLSIQPNPENGIYDSPEELYFGSEGSIRPDEILVFEDGILGVQAARAAGMRVVWVPGPEVRRLSGTDNQDGKMADEILESLDQWDGSAWGLPSFD